MELSGGRDRGCDQRLTAGDGEFFFKMFFLLPIFFTSEMLLQYTAMFLKDPSEKEEKMKEVVGNTLPQGLLRSSLKSHF